MLISATDITGIQNYLDMVIKDIWLNNILLDYKEGHLLLEDALKCSFYFHLRKRLSDDWLKEQNVRMYPEYRIGSKKADLAIVKMKEHFDFKETHLRESVESVLAIIEFKYKVGEVSDNPFFRDWEKVIAYAKTMNGVQVYGCFLHEYPYSNHPDWSNMLSETTLTGSVSVLWGYWDSLRNLVVKIKSYDNNGK